MKLNEDKSYIFIVGHKHETVWANIGCSKIWESQSQKLLGVVIDRSFNFIVFCLFGKKLVESSLT